MAIPYVPPTPDNANLTDDEITSMLYNVAKEFDKSQPDMAKSLRDYLQKRLEYIANYKGKYAQITGDGIHMTDTEILGDEDLSFHGKLKGFRPRNRKATIYYTHNVHKKLQCAYNNVHKYLTYRPNIYVCFGDRNSDHWIENIHAIVNILLQQNIYVPERR